MVCVKKLSKFFPRIYLCVEYKEGTPVTVETYNAWWAEFQAEMSKNKKGNSQEDPLTGKQFFLKMGDAAIEDETDSDEAEGEGEEEVDGAVDIKGNLSQNVLFLTFLEEAAVEVNWEVFEEGTLEGLDDLEFSESEGDN